MPDFSRRSEAVEIMDDLNCSGEVVHQTLRELETINKWLGGNYVTIDGVSKLLKQRSSRKITIADLGCGGGDILKLIRKWSKRKGFDLDLVGIDANPNITAFAKVQTDSSMNISYEPIDIFSDEFKRRKFDIVLGTLFFHHFTIEQLISFFRQAKEQASIGIVINDIHRHWFAYYSIKWLTGFFSKSPMVKYDAPLSVMRAFRKKELIDIMKQAGITNYTLTWMWAFRWQLVIRLGEPSLKS
jgi:2-polyprenyl-3-methyl-5-hydroxy-6-metoxy-1,4-benzoquinol methylase